MDYDENIYRINLKNAITASDLIYDLSMFLEQEEVKRRIIKRGKETNEQIIERFKTAYKELNEIPNYNYIVVNDNIYEAVNKIEAILTSIKCRVDRIEELSMENEEEIIHELLLDSKKYNNKPLNIK